MRQEVDRTADGDPGVFVGFGADDLVIGQFEPDGERHADFSAQDVDTIRIVWRYTVTSPERIHALICAVEHVIGNHIAGDVVECGVWRGGSMMAVALTLLRLGVHDRTLWLYDTYAGMTQPGLDDIGYDGVPARLEFDRRRITAESSTWAAASLDDVRANLASTGYPDLAQRFVQGPVEHTIPATVPDRIALLRLDTDWYASTRHELQHLYPRLVPGGILIVDDYGHWRGAGKAIDEYLAQLRPRPFLHRVDYTARLIIKP